MRREMSILVLATALLVPPMSLAQPVTGGAAPAGGETETGLAAVYSHRLNGRRTASGERLNQNALTTSHKTLPFGTKVRITRYKNGKSVVLRVNDRGPTQAGRIVDITRAAAKALALNPRAMAEVKLEVVETAAKSHHK